MEDIRQLNADIDAYRSFVIGAADATTAVNANVTVTADTDKIDALDAGNVNYRTVSLNVEADASGSDQVTLDNLRNGDGTFDWLWKKGQKPYTWESPSRLP